MTNTAVIHAVSGSFDSRLFFPGIQHLDVWLSNVFGGDDIGYDSGSIYFHAGKFDYELTLDGRHFDKTDWNDVHGLAESGTLSRKVHGNYETIAKMTLFADTDNFYGAAPINSAGWLTPDNLLSGLASAGGGARLELFGNTGNDKLYGSARGDFFNGGNGHDILAGYGGNDEFLFDAIGKANADHITDFTHSHDTILLDKVDDPNLFKGVTLRNLVNTFHDITTQAEQADDRILYNHNTGTLSYDHDGKGGDAAIIFATLDNHAKLTSGDFDIF
jgi:Ca2+-binding RTX toxin-like protein